jgi:hypothetical protein
MALAQQPINFIPIFHHLIEKDTRCWHLMLPLTEISEGSRINAVIYCEMIEKVIKLYGPVNGFSCPFIWWNGT